MSSFKDYLRLFLYATPTAKHESDTIMPSPKEQYINMS